MRKSFNSPFKKGKMAFTPTNAATFDKLAKAATVHVTASHEKKLEKDKDLLPTAGTNSAMKNREVDRSETRFREKSENKKRERSEKPI